MNSRARDLGLNLPGTPGPNNAITDVAGVQVGQETIVEGQSARTGVTAILPNSGQSFSKPLFASGHVINGAGEICGLNQVLEWGLLETPILLTNTMSLGVCADTTVRYMLKAFPEIAEQGEVVIPVVGECDDSWLNDSPAMHVTAEHVLRAIQRADSGPVAEGSVGAGTGMTSFGWKAGIGTSSRTLEGGMTLGVLVQSNFGNATPEELRICGQSMNDRPLPPKRKESGSIIIVIATDAPLLPDQLCRLSRRAVLGLGRLGGVAGHGSGEFVISFSTAQSPGRQPQRVERPARLSDSFLDPLFTAAAQATEESVLNALCAAKDMTGRRSRTVKALPFDWLK